MSTSQSIELANGTLHGKRNFADVANFFADLGRQERLDYRGGRRRPVRKARQESHVMGRGWGARANKQGQPPEGGEREETDGPLDDSERAWPGWDPDCGPMRPFPHSGL